MVEVKVEKVNAIAWNFSQEIFTMVKTSILGSKYMVITMIILNHKGFTT